jgi:hypothetical protein
MPAVAATLDDRVKDGTALAGIGIVLQSSLQTIAEIKPSYRFS